MMRLFSFHNDHGSRILSSFPFQNRSKNVPKISGSTNTNTHKKNMLYPVINAYRGEGVKEARTLNFDGSLLIGHYKTDSSVIVFGKFIV